jgi:hypothetical protein
VPRMASTARLARRGPRLGGRRIRVSLTPFCPLRPTPTPPAKAAGAWPESQLLQRRHHGTGASQLGRGAPPKTPHRSFIWAQTHLARVRHRREADDQIGAGIDGSGWDPSLVARSRRCVGSMSTNGFGIAEPLDPRVHRLQRITASRARPRTAARRLAHRFRHAATPPVSR